MTSALVNIGTADVWQESQSQLSVWTNPVYKTSSASPPAEQAITVLLVLVRVSTRSCNLIGVILTF